MFETQYYCSDCNHVFHKITDHDPRKKAGRIPSCPDCRSKKDALPQLHTKIRGDVKPRTEEEKMARIQDMCASQKPPAMGPTMRSKAFDATSEMVMQDYGMTNIEMNSNLRPGDNCVPKLAPELERRVDEVFKPQKNNVAGMSGAMMNSVLTNQINAGAFRNYGGAGDVVARQQASGISVPTQILYEHRGPPK